MSLLQQVRTGKEAQPPRIMIYGSEGIGKSTFAASAPKPIFIQTEDGLGEIDCAKFPLVGSFDEMMNQLAAIRDEEHEYQTLVIDSSTGWSASSGIASAPTTELSASRRPTAATGRGTHTPSPTGGRS